MTTMTLEHASALGALLARHPVEVWLAGMAAAALSGALALGALRGVRQRTPAAPRQMAPVAVWMVVAALGASACMLAVGAAMLAHLAESGHTGSPWGALDDAIARGLQQHASTQVLRWFAGVTHLGDAWALAALALAVAGVLWARRHRVLATSWLVAMAGNGVLTRVLKSTFERVRPEHVHGIAQADGFSFPSGHSSASMVAYTLLAYLATRLLPQRWHLPAVLSAGAVIFTTGWSRVVLQVHYASDVLAGWLLGGTWALCTVLVVESVARWRRPA